MSLPVVFDSDAEIEAEEAALWYEERRSGLGLEFIAAVGRIVLDIGEMPNRFPAWKHAMEACRAASLPLRHLLRD